MHSTTFTFAMIVLMGCSIQLARSDNNNQTWTPIPKETAKLNYTTNSRIDEQKIVDDTHRNVTEVGRTFGILKRMKMAMPAIMFKLGVITTMLGFLMLFSMKSLGILLTLLILNLSGAFAKLYAHKKGQDNIDPQNIHVHVHGGGESHSSPGHYYTSSHNSGHEHPPWEKSSSIFSSKSDNDFYYYNKYKELRDSLYSQEI